MADSIRELAEVLDQAMNVGDCMLDGLLAERSNLPRAKDREKGAESICRAGTSKRRCPVGAFEAALTRRQRAPDHRYGRAGAATAGRFAG